MKLRTLGIVMLTVLIAGLLWMLRPRGSQPAPVAPTPAPIVENNVDATPLESVAAASPVRESAQPAPANEAHAATDFALVKVLVLNKTTRVPLPDIDVYAIYDTGSGGRTFDETTRSHGKPFETLHTDAEGRVEIEMPPNVSSIVNANGTKHGAGSERADIPALTPWDVHEVVVELATGDEMPFWMKFVDETSHAPIAGVHVSTGKGGESKVTSDAQGLALWPGRTLAPEFLQVDADAYAGTYLKSEPGHAESSSPFVVTLANCANVNVHVVDASGQAIVGAKVDLVTGGYAETIKSANSIRSFHTGDLHWQGVTDPSGHATITCIPPHVPINAGLISPTKWIAPDKLMLEPGETRALEWKLGVGCNVHGIVLDQSNVPVKPREMWLSKTERKLTVYFDTNPNSESRSAKTDEQGRFRFDDVSTGMWRLGPSAPQDGKKIADDDVAAIAQVIEISDGQRDLDVTVRVDRGLFIRGALLNAKGEPTKDGSIWCVDPTNSLSTRARVSSQEGSFALGPLKAGHYVLTALGDGSNAVSEPVEADSGTSNVVLRLREGASLSGTVTGTSGELVQTDVRVRMRNDEWQSVHGVNTHNDGTFQISGLEAGTYDISARGSGGAFALLEGVKVGIGESRTGLDVHLIRGGQVRVRHEGPDHYINVTVFVNVITVDMDGVERGTSHEFVAPAGTVIVQASYYEAEKRTVERTVEVKAGETVDVVFEKDAH